MSPRDIVVAPLNPNKTRIGFSKASATNRNDHFRKDHSISVNSRKCDWVVDWLGTFNSKYALSCTYSFPPCSHAKYSSPLLFGVIFVIY